MSSTAGAATLLIVLAVLIAIGFIGMWLRDKGRADEEAQDGQRTAPDPNAENRRESYTHTPPVNPGTTDSGPARPE
jgi:hypothetical protein